MVQSNRTTKTAPRQTAASRQAGARRLNRSEQRAMEIRAAASAAERAATAAPAEPTAATEVVPRRERRTRAGSRAGATRQVSRGIVLTRAQEYAFIRADLRRLAILSVALVVLMVVVLLVAEGLY